MPSVTTPGSGRAVAPSAAMGIGARPPRDDLLDQRRWERGRSGRRLVCAVRRRSARALARSRLGLHLGCLADRRLGQVDHAVEHHRPDPLGEQLGVHLADRGAVRVAEVGELARRRGPCAAGPCPGRRPRVPAWASTSSGACVRHSSTKVLLIDEEARPVARRPRSSGRRRTSPGPGCGSRGRCVPPTPRGSKPTMSKRSDVSSAGSSPAPHEADRRAAWPTGVDEERADALARLGRRASGDGQRRASRRGSV